MGTTTVVTVLAVFLQIPLGNSYINLPRKFKTADEPKHSTPTHAEDSDILGSIGGHAHLHGLKTRAKLHAIATRAKLHAHHHHLLPLLLLSPTPEEFLNDDIITPDPVLGQSNPYEHIEQPQIHNVIYQNQQASFSIPENWKPPPYSNLYGYPNSYYPNDGSLLSVLPGQWKENNAYANYYKDYDVKPISYIIPDDYSPSYARSAQPSPHFHGHYRGNQHSVIQNNSPKKQVYYTSLPQNSFNDPHSQASIHEDISSHSQSQEFYAPLSHHPAPHNSHITTNKQSTVLVLPPSGGNFQISQISGNHNAVSQSQAAHGHNLQHTQSSQVAGNHNSASQFQNVEIAPFVSKPAGPIVGAPNVVNVGRSRKLWNIAGPDAANINVVIKRSIVEKELKSNNRKRRQAFGNYGWYPFNNVEYVPCKKPDYVPIVGAPSLFSVQPNKKLFEIPGPETADISVVIKQSRKKRTVPALKLFLNPNAKVDVPKTFDNIGEIAKHSFESKHQPLHHLTNAMGSARDALISTLKIPPQDLFVPSKYAIVNKETINGAKSNENSMPNGIRKEDDIYNKIGNMFRDSIRSGQDALSHAGEFIHSARKALTTSKNVAPRLMISSLRVPALQHKPLFPKLTFKNDMVGAEHFSDRDPNFVGVHHIIDALGRRNPGTDEINVGNNYNMEFQDSPQSEDIYQTLDALENAKKSMGVKSLKEFFAQMKQDLQQRSRLQQATQGRSGMNRHRMTRMQNDLGDDRYSKRIDAINALDMAVSLASNVTNELLDNPTINPPESSDPKGEDQVSHFLLDLFDIPDTDHNAIKDNFSESRLDLHDKRSDDMKTRRNKRQIDYEFLKAINPEMFKELFNIPLESAKKYDNRNPTSVYNENVNDKNQRLGIGMTMGDALITPFMGKLERQEIHRYPYYMDEYDEYDDGY